MKRVLNKIDKPLLIVSFICIIFGVMMVGSASSLKAYMSYGDSYHYLTRQLLFVAIGLIAAIIIIKTPIKKYKSLIWLVVLGVIGALGFVLVSDKISNGIKGWMFIGGFGIQPSEFAKTATILFLALSYEKMMKLRDISNVYKILPFAVPIAFMGLIILQPDLGTMIILLGITVSIFFVLPFDKQFKWIVAALGVISALILVVIMLLTGKGLSDMQKSRLNFTKPCTRYREETGYQVCNGYIAINSGGITGVGLGNSKQKYLYLPEAHTDFIFAIIIEETGLISGALMFVAYFAIIWRILKIGKKSYNLQGTIICYGVATYIFLHIFVNLGGAMGLIPLTGVPLPFYSYGGSFMINLLICLGLVQRVSVENKLFEQKHLVG